MRELVSLIKVSLNVNFGISALKYKYFRQKKELWQPILFLVAMFSLIPSYVLYLGLLNGLYIGFKMIGQESLFLLLGLLVSQLIIFIFGIVYVASKFYFSNDLQLLIPLPIKPGNIIIAKFITLLVNEYLTILPFVLPIIIKFGIKEQLGVSYWIYSIVIFIILPIIPLGLASVIVMLFMKYTNIKGKRDLIRVIGFILIIVIILSVQFGIQSVTNKIPTGQEEEYIANLLKNNNEIIKRMGSTFPPSILAVMALTQHMNIEGLISLVIFVTISIIIFYCMVFLGERIFYKGLIGGEEVRARKRKLSNKELEKNISKTNHPIVSILLREIRILTRTPVFLMNSIGAVIIIPIAILIPLVMSGEGFEVISQFYNERYITLINLGIVGFLMFVSATNGVASTTFSREGRQFWISRVIPVKVQYQLLGKIISSLMVQLLAIVVVLLSASFLIKFKVSTIIIVVVLGLLGSIPITELGILIDILRPLLDWDNPQKAMKQNLNVLFSMVIGMVYILLYGGLVFAFSYIKLNSIVIYSLLFIIFSLLSIGIFLILAGTTIKRFKEIE